MCRNIIKCLAYKSIGITTSISKTYGTSSIQRYYGTYNSNIPNFKFTRNLFGTSLAPIYIGFCFVTGYAIYAKMESIRDRSYRISKGKKDIEINKERLAVMKSRLKIWKESEIPMEMLAYHKTLDRTRSLQYFKKIKLKKFYEKNPDVFEKEKQEFLNNLEETYKLNKNEAEKYEKKFELYKKNIITDLSTMLLYINIPEYNYDYAIIWTTICCGSKCYEIPF